MRARGAQGRKRWWPAERTPLAFTTSGGYPGLQALVFTSLVDVRVASRARDARDVRAVAADRGPKNGPARDGLATHYGVDVLLPLVSVVRRVSHAGLAEGAFPLLTVIASSTVHGCGFLT